ncbi:uncharacterized protein [Patagioenas fasciata]|uniref:uncharacterized protein isoform X2 n=1 Tax=Patagioenas fasciata TaxID=372321 RepID=UPI003A99F866
MATRGWRPVAAAAIAAARPGGGGPGRGPGTGPGSGAAPEPVPEPAAPATAALYVHWPYCRKRCSYCNFNKYVVPTVDEAAVRACLVQEARTLLRLSQVQSVTSVFFGGGTPSLASPRTIAAVLEAVARAAYLPVGAEVTLEANPSSTSPARLAGFREVGINRLSIGVQSLDDAELRLLGREHTAAEARGAVEAARGLFPGRTSIDLLFGLPGQSQDAWARGLAAALRLCDDHISLYQLTLERGTALAAQVWGGTLPAPPQDLLADMYQTARAMLVSAGFRHYEVSNFARKGALSTHNLSYWRAEQYIGVGPGAHGRFVPRGEGGGSREARVQTLEPDAWMREVRSQGHGTRRRVVLSPLEQLEELLALGLRTDEGITHEGECHEDGARLFSVTSNDIQTRLDTFLWNLSWVLLLHGGIALDELSSAGGTSPPSSACRPCSGSRGRRRISSSRAGCSWTAAACGARRGAWPCWTPSCPTCSASCSAAGPASRPGSGSCTGRRGPEEEPDGGQGRWRGRGSYKKDKVCKQSSTIIEEPEPVPCVLQGDDIQALAINVEDFKKDLDGLEVIGKGQPFASLSAEPLPCSTSSEESEILSDTLKGYPDVVPEAVRGPSLVFCGQPARWIDGTTSRRNEVGIAARLNFEALAGERAESSLTVSNDGTTAIWYDWLRLPQKIPSRETKWRRLPWFYFDTRSGVILPGETRQFVFIFKSESAGIFSESWEFRTHPLLLGGALLQVTLWGIAVYEDKLADLREKLESDLAARVRAAIVKEILKKLPAQIRTPERTPSPVDAYITEEELFQRKNPKLHYHHRVVQQLHELWRKHMTVPSAFWEKVSLGQTSSVEDLWCQENSSGVLSAQSSVTEASGWKSTLVESPSQMANVEQEEPGPSGWNLSIEDFKQAIKSIPKEEQREAALAQLNQAVLELRVPQRPVQSDLFYHICLQLWRETIDGLVSHSMRLRSLLGLPENNTYADTVPEETEPRLSIKEGKEDKIMTKKPSVGGKDKEAKKRTTKAARKEKEEQPNSRKLKDEKRQKSSISSQDGRVEAQSLEALTTKREPSHAQIDPVLFGTYQEKLYVHVYGLLRSMVIKMVSLFEDLETKKVP